MTGPLIAYHYIVRQLLVLPVTFLDRHQIFLILRVLTTVELAIPRRANQKLLRR